MGKKKNTLTEIAIPLVFCFGIVVGVIIGASVDSTSIFRGSNDNIKKLNQVFTILNREYVDTISMTKILDNSITDILKKLDPHSVYIPASERIEADEYLNGSFEGIGIEFNVFNDTIVVIQVIADSPSKMAGLLVGDRILKVDSQNVANVGISNTGVIKLLKGPRGSIVKLAVLRKNKNGPLDITIKRDRIIQKSVDVGYMIKPDIGYIKINRFSKSTYTEFMDELNQLHKKGMQKLIIDLQGNPGGFLDQTIELADEFLPANKKIVFTEGHNKKYDSENFSTSKGEFETGDLLILVNEESASASEILAGALQDNDRALIIGRRTFGKGLVQTVFDLVDGSEMRLTISRYYTPSGRSIQKPYTDSEEYSKDISSRFSRGEFFHSDSIRFKDSLKYYTTKGRPVFGGGGIMPDFFVPLDSSENSEYLNNLFFAGTIQQFALDFVEKEKPKLTQMGLEKFCENFVLTDAMLKQIGSLGVKNKIVPDLEDLKQHRKSFEILIGAQIAKLVWGNVGFYSIYNESNEVLNEALKLFDQIYLLH